MDEEKKFLKDIEQAAENIDIHLEAVSYTHLTLPTILRV